jgi:hypothetical protein
VEATGKEEQYLNNIIMHRLEEDIDMLENHGSVKIGLVFSQLYLLKQ